MHKKMILPNGLRLVTTEMPNAQSASVAIFVGVGSRYETAETAGISHFIEHMLFKGTTKRPTGKEISEAIEGVGGIINAEAGKEMTVYWAKVTTEHFPLALDVIADLLLHSKFEPEEIDKERKVIIEELNMLVDSPTDWVDVLFDETIWHNQPLGRDIAGTKETVCQISRDSMLHFFRQNYTPANCVVSVAGPFPEEYVLDYVMKALGNWAPGEKPAPALPPVPTQGSRLRIEYKKTEQANLCLGVPGYSYNHPDRFPTDLLNVILGEGMSSRLFQEIREQRGLAYDVHSYVHHLRDTGANVVYAGVEPRQIENAMRAIIEQLELLKEPIPNEELVRAKESWKGRMILRLEDTKAIASWMGSQELLLDRIMTVDEVIAAIESISAADLSRVARDLFQTEKLYLSVVGPFKNDSRFSKLLKV